MRKFLAGLAIAYLMLAAIGWATVSTRLHDVSEPDDADLIEEPSGLPAPEANAFAQLLLATEPLELEEDTRNQLSAALNGSQPETELRVVLAGYEDTLTAALGALDLPSSQVVFPPNLADEERVARKKRFLDALRLLSARAMMRAREGACAAAYEDVDGALRLARRLNESRGTDLVLAMLATAGEQAAFHAGDALISRCPLSAAGSLSWQRKLEASRPSASAWADPIRVEYRVMKQLLLASKAEDWGGPRHSSRLLSSYSLQTNRTLSELARHYRHAAAWECGDVPEPLPSPQPGALTMLAPNGIGRLMLALSVPDYGKYHTRTCTALAERAAHVARIALRSWQSDHGALPEKFDALVPGYLASVPRDPASDGPLRYSPKERRLSAAGELRWSLSW